MTKHGENIVLTIIAAVFLAAVAVGTYRSGPDEPALEWTQGGMSAPQESTLIAVWYTPDGIVSEAVQRIGSGFYEAGPSDTAVGLFGGPPDYWALPPRKPR
jgi:hypothetical protein